MTTRLTPAEYRALSLDAHNRKIESFDRCDTDGFLSQWALDCMSNKYAKMAQLAEQDFQAAFETLADLDGNLVPCREIDTKFGWCYAVYATFDEAVKCGQIIEFVGKTERAAKKKGYKFVTVRTEATVEVTGGYTAQVYVTPVNSVLTPDNCVIVTDTQEGN
jgi:hypothetical protein